MKVRQKNGHWFPKLMNKLGVSMGAITLYPFVLYLEDDPQWETIIHEGIHVQQVQKYWWFRFYSTYVLYYLIGLLAFFSHDKAYKRIPWEQEAYEHQYDEDYLIK